MRVGSANHPDPHGNAKTAKGDGSCPQRNHLAEPLAARGPQHRSWRQGVTALLHGGGGEDHEANGKPHKGDLHDPQGLALARQWRAPPPGLAGESPFHAAFIRATFMRASLTYANGPPESGPLEAKTVAVVTSCGLPPSWRDP